MTCSPVWRESSWRFDFVGLLITACAAAFAGATFDLRTRLLALSRLKESATRLLGKLLFIVRLFAFFKTASKRADRFRVKTYKKSKKVLYTIRHRKNN